MNSTTINIHNHGMGIKHGFTSLSKTTEEIKDLIDLGSIISEVGESHTKTLSCYEGSFQSFALREPQNSMIPKHIFGTIDMGDAASAVFLQRLSVPAVGADIVVDPQWYELQRTIMSQYTAMRYDVQWFIHIPAPLGSGIYIEVQALEYDSQTSCRSLKWKPQAIPTIAVHVPFESDVAVVPIGYEQRSGFPGGSIKITTIEDNSNPTILSMDMVVGCAITNIQGIGLKPTGFSKDSSLTFNPSKQAIKNTNYQLIEQSDNAEVNVEGGAGVDQIIVDTPENPMIIETDKPINTENTTPGQGSATGYTELQHLATKWTFFDTILLTSSADASWKELTIDPLKIGTLGEQLNNPWRRNVWVSGKLVDGVLSGLVLQVNIPRAPTLSGIVEFTLGLPCHRYLVEFGSRVEIPLVPSAFIKPLPLSNIHVLVNPWLKTHEQKFKLHYRILAVNTNIEKLDLSMRLAIKPGYSCFQIPKRVEPKTENKFINILKTISLYGMEDKKENRDENLTKKEGLQVLEEQSMDNEIYFTPGLGVEPEQGSKIYDEGNEEYIPLDDFPIKVFDGTIDTETQHAIHFNLPAIADLLSEDSENPITQKMMRFAKLNPIGANGYGPVVGTYTIKIHVPTGVVGEIHHVCLPGDMIEETVTRLFGFSKILGIAGSAVSAVGGPMLSGIINTASTATSTAAHLIGGPLVGSLADAGLGIVKNILPGGKKHTPPPQTHNSAIGGLLPIARHITNLRPVKKNYDKSPVLPTLLLEATKFLGNDLNPIKKVPIEIFANLEYVKVARSVFNRVFNPIEDFKTSTNLMLSEDTLLYVIERGLNNKNTFISGTTQEQWMLRILSILKTKGKLTTVTLSEIESAPVEQGINVTKALTSMQLGTT